MKFIKHDYWILTSEGLQLCRGYLYTDRGILFGIDQRGKNNWIITDIKSGLKVKTVGLRKYAKSLMTNKEIELVKELHEKQYIKHGNKFFISGNQELIDKFLEV